MPVHEQLCQYLVKQIVKDVAVNVFEDKRCLVDNAPVYELTTQHGYATVFFFEKLVRLHCDSSLYDKIIDVPYNDPQLIHKLRTKLIKELL